MNLDELKKNMSLLDDVLEQKTSDTLTFDRPKCNGIAHIARGGDPRGAPQA